MATLVVVLTLAGFPVALALAWAFDVTPGGVQVTKALDSGVGPKARGLVAVFGVGLALALVVAAIVFVPSSSRDGPALESDQAVPPPTYEAFVEFAQAMEHYSAQQFRLALPFAHRAIALDSTFAAAMVLAGAIHMELGDPAGADSMVTVLNHSRDRLTPAERAMRDFLAAELRGDLEGSLRAARRLVEVGGTSWSFHHAWVASQTNRLREAVEALEAADPNRQVIRWPDYYYLLSDSYHNLGEYERELEVAHRARLEYPGLVGPDHAEMSSLAALGRLEELDELLERSLARPQMKVGTTAVYCAGSPRSFARMAGVT